MRGEEIGVQWPSLPIGLVRKWKGAKAIKGK